APPRFPQTRIPTLLLGSLTLNGKSPVNQQPPAPLPPLLLPLIPLLQLEVIWRSSFCMLLPQKKPLPQIQLKLTLLLTPEIGEAVPTTAVGAATAAAATADLLPAANNYGHYSCYHNL
ncbi:Hypothetical predicted protein, partial [Marmota monax]